MIRKIIKIDEEKCNAIHIVDGVAKVNRMRCVGCGACAAACHEGAIDMVNGKAKLMREDYCDGLGDCLPACPTGAITFEEREAPEYNEEAVKKAKMHKAATMLHGGCPGSRSRAIERKNEVPKSTNTFSESRLRAAV